MTKSTICVVGLGYIGLPTGLLLADSGFNVYGFDIDHSKIKALKNGQLFFQEPGINELWESVLEKKTFYPVSQIPIADAYIISVPTPQQEDKLADLRFVLKALDIIKPVFKSGSTIIVESTIGPGDSRDRIIPKIKQFKKAFHYGHCPERAIPGQTLYEMVHNARIIGALSKTDGELIKTIYQSFVKGDIYLTSPIVAESCKVMENTYRDVNIALANELSKIAEEVGFNIWEAIELANKHPRVNIHTPGLGVGGHCIPIDPWFFVGVSQQASLIETARQINDRMPMIVGRRIKQLVQKYKLSNPRIGILGYAYKKNVDDARETPVNSLIKTLEGEYSILLNDPFVKEAARSIVTLKKLLSSCDIVILAVDHDKYKDISFKDYPNIKLVFDAKNLFQKHNFAGARCYRVSLGTPK